MLAVFHPDKVYTPKSMDQGKGAFFSILGEILEIFNKRSEQLYAFLYKVQGEGHGFMDEWVMQANIRKATEALEEEAAGLKRQVLEVEQLKEQTQRLQVEMEEERQRLQQAQRVAADSKEALANVGKQLADIEAQGQAVYLRKRRQDAADYVDGLRKDLDNRAAAEGVREAASEAKGVLSEMQQATTGAKDLVLVMQQVLESVWLAASEAAGAVKESAEAAAARTRAEAESEAERVVAAARAGGERILQQAVLDAKAVAEEQTDAFVAEIKSKLLRVSERGVLSFDLFVSLCVVCDCLFAYETGLITHVSHSCLLRRSSHWQRITRPSARG